jgi:uncharacterized protein
MSMRVSRYVFASDIDDQGFAIIAHGYSGAVDKIDGRVATEILALRGADAANLSSRVNPSTRKLLAARGYLTDLTAEQERDLVISLSRQMHAHDLATTPTGFMFVPAYTCNLRCPYCFQPHEFHKGVGRYGVILSRELVDAGFKLVERFGPPGSLARHLGLLDAETADGSTAKPFDQIGLFGGEPLSAETVDIVEYIVAQARHRGMAVTAITNGVELDLFAHVMAPDGLREVQITLDGMPHVHDRRRIGPNFRKSFQRISDNIDLALSRGVKVSLRMNVDTARSAPIAPCVAGPPMTCFAPMPPPSVRRAAIASNPAAPNLSRRRSASPRRATRSFTAMRRPRRSSSTTACSAMGTRSVASPIVRRKRDC